MKFSKDERSELFEKTEISDIFFTEYIAEAPPVAIKLYIYLLYYTKYNKEISLNDLPKILGISYSDMNFALDYWTNKGVLVRKNSEYSIVPVEQIEFEKLYKPKIGLSPADIASNAKAQYMEKTIQAINDKYFQGMMSTSWYNDILLWFKKYKFSEEVMLALFEQGYKNGAVQHRNYLQAIAVSWANNNVKTYKDLDNYYQKLDKFNILTKKIKRSLKIKRELSSFEEDMIRRWSVDLGYDFDVINLALAETVKISNPSFKYIDKILDDWADKKLKTVDDIKKYTEDFNKRQSDFQKLKSSLNNNNKFNKSKSDKGLSKQKFDNLNDYYD